MAQAHSYKINDIFVSLQGEGALTGTPAVFVRFSGCNLRCDTAPGPRSPGGWACDTEFESGRALTLAAIDEIIEKRYDPNPMWLILTGGEPTLQVDDAFIAHFQEIGFQVAIETNGTRVVSDKMDWITVSPKVAEHAIRQLKADEVKYVRGYGQEIPETVVDAEHYFISPAFEGDHLPPDTLQWCIELVKRNPDWRLSVQMHKLLGIA